MNTEPFRKRIRHSLENEVLQLALDANAARRKQARSRAFASLPDYQERRQRAHAIKADVVARLDEYLAQFTANAEKNGMIVHRAADAGQAAQLVLEILAGLPPKAQRLIAKSKSMVSEEIYLNHALEAAGYRVVETDLGEYIVQLRGERPAHIITPAVHLRRQEVGQLFAEKLGLPYTEDIPTLTNTARKVLRQVFLTADVGISGVNFGIAESGTLVLVTNEGNGRMVTTLPPVHIALMGMERLIPGLDDLALFLSLLSRSATGQKLSVYTSLINAPLPGQSRHLIVLDNGRSALRASPLAESLFCIRCGACLNVCPVFRELGGHAYGSIYPGPIGSVISSALVDPQFDYLAQASSLCGACREACPVDIDLPGLLLRVRAGDAPQQMQNNPGKQKQGKGLPAAVRWGLRTFRFAASTGSLFAVFQTLGGLLSRFFSPRRAWMRLPAFTGWGYSKDFPRLAVRPFRARWRSLRQTLWDGAGQAAGQERIADGAGQAAGQERTADGAGQAAGQERIADGAGQAAGQERIADGAGQAAG
ncbi:MAG: lactate utilization protein B, partial [Candidatus Villigracilaceae bacterium]